MEALTQIIKVLKPGEVRLIRNFYKIQSNGEVQKRLALFDLIKSEKCRSDQEVCSELYGVPPHSAYSHLKARLKKDILSLLLLQEGAKRYEAKYAQAIFECRRMIIAGQMLIERGAYNMGVEILKDANKLAKKYELYNEDVTINDILRSHLGVKRGVKEYNLYNGQINEQLDKQQKLLQAKDHYHRILVPNLFHKNRELHLAEYSQEAIEQLRKSYEETGSANIGYYYYYVSIFYYHIQNDMVNALVWAQKFLHLIETSPAVHSASRIASANFQIAAIMVNLGEYKNATKHARIAIDKFATGLLNELAAIEILFYAAFHANDLAQAREALKKARSHPKLKANKLNPAKWDYFEANILFAEGDYDKASDKLLGYSELLKDKAGWLMGYRILELMCMSEMNELDLMDFRNESFRKLLQRQKAEAVDRPKAIFKIMESFIKTGGSVLKTQKVEANRLELLRKGEGTYRWDPLGFELIRFDTWFDAKQ